MYSKLKILLYVTTHLSILHKQFMNQCWYNMYMNITKHANVNVHLYITNNATMYNSSYLPFPHTFTQVHNYGYQAGAISALYNKRMQKLFRTYDWIIRLNPDVIIYNVISIIDLMNNPSVYGIFGNCNLRELSRVKQIFPFLPFNSYPDKCISGCVHRRIMTDFTIFRGNVSLAHVPRSINAEDDATLLFHKITRSYRDRWIYPYNIDKSCRTRLYNTIVHEHSTSRCNAYNK